MDDYAKIYRQSLKRQHDQALDYGRKMAKDAFSFRNLCEIGIGICVTGATASLLFPASPVLATCVAAGSMFAVWTKLEKIVVGLGQNSAVKFLEPFSGADSMGKAAQNRREFLLSTIGYVNLASYLTMGTSLSVAAIAALAAPALMPVALCGFLVAGSLKLTAGMECGESYKYLEMSEANPYRMQYARNEAKAICATQQAAETLEKDMTAAFNEFMKGFNKAQTVAPQPQKTDAPKPPADKPDMG